MGIQSRDSYRAMRFLGLISIIGWIIFVSVSGNSEGTRKDKIVEKGIKEKELSSLSQVKSIDKRGYRKTKQIKYDAKNERENRKKSKNEKRIRKMNKKANKSFSKN